MATKTDPPATRHPTKQADKYDKPDLRQHLKQQIIAGDKGGKSGQWSVRKARLLTHDYEKAGDGYRWDQQTDQQQHLAGRTDQAWQTADGQPADREGGTLLA